MEQNSDNKKRKKKLIFLVFLLIIVTIGMVVTIALITSKQNESKIDPRSFEEMFWDSETAEEAITTFQKKIDATTDPEQKAELYSERAKTLFTIFSNEKLYSEQIIQDAENAYMTNTKNLKYLYQIDNYCIFFNKESSSDYCQKKPPTLIKKENE